MCRVIYNRHLQQIHDMTVTWMCKVLCFFLLIVPGSAWIAALQLSAAARWKFLPSVVFPTEQLIPGPFGSAVILRHTPARHAQMKYFGIKQPSYFFQCQADAALSDAAQIQRSLYCFLSFMSETLPVCCSSCCCDSDPGPRVPSAFFPLH